MDDAGERVFRYLFYASTGVTPIALIVAAVFWTWLWGPPQPDGHRVHIPATENHPRHQLLPLRHFWTSFGLQLENEYPFSYRLRNTGDP